MNKFGLIGDLNVNLQPIPTSYVGGFSFYESLSNLLDTINQLINSNNLGADEIVDLQQKKQDIATYLNDIKINRKLDEKGDFTGTWNGLEMHQTSEGLATDWNSAKGSFDTVSNRLDDIDSIISDIFHIARGVDIAVIINQLLNSGIRNIKIPSGTFNISTPIILKNKCEISSNKDTILTTSLDIPILKSEEIVNQVLIDCYLHDLHIINTHNQPSHYHIELCNSAMCKIERVIIETISNVQSAVGGISCYKFGEFIAPNGTYSVCIDKCDLRNSSIELSITDNYITNTNVWGQGRSFAIHFIKSSQQLNNCQLVGSSVNGALYIKDTISNYDVENIKVNNCFFDGSYDNIQSGTGIIAYKMRGSVISSNAFWQQKANGIELHDCFNNTISSNAFNNTGMNNSTTGSNTYYNINSFCDILVYGTLANSIICNNTFMCLQTMQYKPYSINLSGYTGGSGNIIKDNVTRNETYYQEQPYIFPSGMLSSTNVFMNNLNPNHATPPTNIFGDININGDISSVGGNKYTMVFGVDSMSDSTTTYIGKNGFNRQSNVICSNGSILAIGYNLDSPISQGSISITIQKNGVNMTSSTVTIQPNNYSNVFHFNKDTINVTDKDCIMVIVKIESPIASTKNLQITLMLEG
jgi:hypothetical protein